MLRTHLPALAGQLSVPGFVGGRVALDHARAIKEAGLTPLLGDVQGALQQIDEELASKRGK